MYHGSLARRTSNAVDASAAFELIAGAKAFFLKQMQVTLAAATASTYGLGRPAAIGVTPTTPVSVLNNFDLNTILTAATALAWATPPTIPAQFFRRVSFPATVASSIIWTFVGGGLLVPAGTSLVLWNLATNGVVDISVEIDEQL
jgi:hypothetical protein